MLTMIRLRECSAAAVEGERGGRHVFESQEDDNCETPRQAYQDVAPLLTWLAGQCGLRTALLRTALLRTALLRTALLRTALLRTALLRTAGCAHCCEPRAALTAYCCYRSLRTADCWLLTADC